MSPDATDRVILTMLQDNARTSNAEIARALGIAPSAVHERIRKLEQRGVINGYSANINPESIGLGLTTFVSLRTGMGESHAEAVAALSDLPEVLEIHEIAGDYCLLVKIRTADMKALNTLRNDRIRDLPGVLDSRTTVVMNTIKEGHDVQLPEG